MVEQIRILSVDDDPGFSELFETQLKRAHDSIVVTTVSDPAAAIERARDGNVDCVVSDYEMPGMDGLSLLEALREFRPKLPFILFTGEGSEEIASEAISAGVTDYLQKGSGAEQYTVLANRIENAVAQRRAERAVESSCERLRAMIENATDIITVLDESGVVQYESPSVTRLLGYEDDVLIGDTVFEYIHPDDREEAATTFANLLSESAFVTDRMELRFRHADGSWTWIEAIGSNQRDTSLDGYVINSRLIDDQKTERERFQHLIECSSDVVALIEPDGTHRYVSPSVEHILGYDPDDLIGGDAFARIHPEDVEAVREEFERGLEQQEFIATIEYRIRHADGTWRWFETRGRNLLDDPVVEGFVANSRDVTSRKRREEELRRQNDRLDRFASVLSHDLRNPLQVAAGTLELARETDERDHFETVERAHDRMDRLISDVLTLARQGQSVDHARELDLGRVARDAWDSVDTRSATLSIEDTTRVFADDSRLQALLENLFSNAVEHGGPSVSVTVGTLADGFYVADDGPGVPPDDRTRVFEAGVSTRTEGTGFGLTIVYEIAEAHGWAVSLVESADGGVRFEVVSDSPDDSDPTPPTDPSSDVP